jgi:hypothetical protein
MSSVDLRSDFVIGCVLMCIGDKVSQYAGMHLHKSIADSQYYSKIPHVDPSV